MLYLAESFLSVNGEGLRAGALAYFVRLAGCPLRCSYCDTAWAQQSSAGKLTDLRQIVADIAQSPAPFVTLTGGEPLAAEGVIELIQAILEETDKVLEIETSGAVDVRPLLEAFGDSERLCLTVDYKLPGSGMTERMVGAHYRALRRQDVIKYVITSPEDLREAVKHHREWLKVSDLQHAATPIFSPAYGSIQAAELVEHIKQERLSRVRVQLQLHKYIWDPRVQGV